MLSRSHCYDVGWDDCQQVNPMDGSPLRFSGFRLSRQQRSCSRRDSRYWATPILRPTALNSFWKCRRPESRMQRVSTGWSNTPIYAGWLRCDARPRHAPPLERDAAIRRVEALLGAVRPLLTGTEET